MGDGPYENVEDNDPCSELNCDDSQNPLVVVRCMLTSTHACEIGKELTFSFI